MKYEIATSQKRQTEVGYGKKSSPDRKTYGEHQAHRKAQEFLAKAAKETTSETAQKLLAKTRISLANTADETAKQRNLKNK